MIFKFMNKADINIISEFNNKLHSINLPLLPLSNKVEIIYSKFMKDIIERKLKEIGRVSAKDVNLKNIAEDFENIKNMLHMSEDCNKIRLVQEILFSYKLKYDINIDTFNDIHLFKQALNQKFNISEISKEFKEIFEIYEIEVEHDIKILYNIDELKNFEIYLIKLFNLVDIEYSIEEFISYKLSDLELLIFNIKRSSDYRLKRSQKGVYR